MTQRLMSRHAPARSRGFVLAYLLFALSLVGVVAVGLSQMRDADVQAQKAAENVGRIVKAVHVIATQVSACYNSYPEGGTVALPTGTQPTAVPVFATPDGQLTSGPAEGGRLADAQCPGAPSGARALWTGEGGVFFPEPPAGFGEWRYVLETGGSPLKITRALVTLASDGTAAHLAALRRVAQRDPDGVQSSFDQSTGVLTVVLLVNPT